MALYFRPSLTAKARKRTSAFCLLGHSGLIIIIIVIQIIVIVIIRIVIIIVIVIIIIPIVIVIIIILIVITAIIIIIVIVIVIIILGRGAWGPVLKFEGFSGSSHSGLRVWGCRGQSLRSSLRGA